MASSAVHESMSTPRLPTVDSNDDDETRINETSMRRANFTLPDRSRSGAQAPRSSATPRSGPSPDVDNNGWSQYLSKQELMGQHGLYTWTMQPLHQEPFPLLAGGSRDARPRYGGKVDGEVSQLTRDDLLHFESDGGQGERTEEGVEGEMVEAE